MNPKEIIAISLLRGDMILLKREEIKFILSTSAVTYVHDINGSKFTSVFTIKNFKDILDETFYPFSQSLLVNLNTLKYIYNQDQEIELECGERLPVSRRGLRGFKEWIKERGGVI